MAHSVGHHSGTDISVANGSHPISSSDTEHLAIAGTFAGDIIFAVDMTLIVPILFGNVLTIVAYYKNKKLQLTSNLLVVSLAVTDLTTGLVSIPWVCVVRYGNYGYDQMKYPCLFRIIFGHTPLGISILTLLWMAILRYIAVSHPLKSKIWITKFRIKILAGLLWLFNICLVSGHALLGSNWSETHPVCDTSIVMPKSYSYIMGIYCLGVCVAATALYIRIALIVKSGQKKIQKTVTSNHTTEKRLTHMLWMVLGCFYVCWMPSFFKILVALIFYKGQPEPEWLNIWEQSALTVVFANSFMNPIIYTGMNRTFRETFRNILHLNSQCGYPKVNGVLHKGHYQVTSSQSTSSDQI